MDLIIKQEIEENYNAIEKFLKKTFKDKILMMNKMNLFYK